MLDVVSQGKKWWSWEFVSITGTLSYSLLSSIYFIAFLVIFIVFEK